MSGISVTTNGADRSHVERRQQILEKYPQVRELFGRDPVTFKITAAIFVGQFLIAAWMGYLGLSYWWLSLLLAIMESVYVMTGRTVWRDAVKFWGTLFGVNFVMGVATGITMEFQFGTNWARFSAYAGSVVGHTLAMGAAFSLLYPSLSLIVVERVSETQRGAALGTFTAFFDAGVGLGQAIGRLRTSR